MNPTPSIRLDQSWIQQLPLDLYIPPQAFEIFLDRFEGPLDFLLYLVKKNGVNLLQFDIAPIAQQYIQYIQTLQHHNIELAADYLVMASLLADLKSRLMLPKPTEPVAIEDDPRLDLMAKLEAYARIKQQAQALNEHDVYERDRFDVSIYPPSNTSDFQSTNLQVYAIDLLVHTMSQLLAKQPQKKHHVIEEDTITLADKIEHIRHQLKHLASGHHLSFYALINPQDGRIGIVLGFVAILELLRLGELTLIVNQSNMTDPAPFAIVAV